MSHKRNKAHGVRVSREEVLRELGDPAGWGEETRKLEFASRLKRGAKDLDIGGIRGYAQKGYLAYLEESLASPLGSNTGLITAEASNLIAQKNREETLAEIGKYRARLAELEGVPTEIATYIQDMSRWLDYLVKIGEEDPDSQPIPELEELTREANLRRKKDIARLIRDIRTYTNRLAQLLD